jgi:hypothetical protein
LKIGTKRNRKKNSSLGILKTKKIGKIGPKNLTKNLIFLKTKKGKKT